MCVRERERASEDPAGQSCSLIAHPTNQQNRTIVPEETFVDRAPAFFSLSRASPSPPAPRRLGNRPATTALPPTEPRACGNSARHTPEQHARRWPPPYWAPSKTTAQPNPRPTRPPCRRGRPRAIPTASTPPRRRTSQYFSFFEYFEAAPPLGGGRSPAARRGRSGSKTRWEHVTRSPCDTDAAPPLGGRRSQARMGRARATDDGRFPPRHCERERRETYNCKTPKREARGARARRRARVRRCGARWAAHSPPSDAPSPAEEEDAGGREGGGDGAPSQPFEERSLLLGASKPSSSSSSSSSSASSSS